MKLFFSGIESPSYYQIARSVGVSRILMSYWHIARIDSELLKKRKKQFPDLQVLIDSGAHTFNKCEKEYSKQDFENYVEAYVRWLKKNRGLYDAAVELDIEIAAGMPLVQKWQEKYFRPLEDDGVPIIFCWHPDRGNEGWEIMCKRHRYIGMSVDAYDTGLGNLFTVARQYFCKVHGFAITSVGAIYKYPFYSVDSTTWLAPAQFGATIYWDEIKGRYVRNDDKSCRPSLKGWVKKIGVNVQDFLDDKRQATCAVSADAFMRLEEKVTERHGSKMYWTFRAPTVLQIGRMKDERIDRHCEKIFGAEFVNDDETEEGDNKAFLECISLLQSGKVDEFLNHPYRTEFLEYYDYQGFVDKDTFETVRLFINSQVLPVAAKPKPRTPETLVPTRPMFARDGEDEMNDEVPLESLPEDMNYVPDRKDVPV